METVTDLIFSGSKITADSNSSHKIQRHLLLGRKAMTNLESIFQNRDITLLTKVCIVKAMVFSVVVGCENWSIKVECRRSDVFKLWCWRRFESPPFLPSVGAQSQSPKSPKAGRSSRWRPAKLHGARPAIKTVYSVILSSF